MSKPFKFRYVNEIAGVFVMLVVVALIAAVVLAGRSQGWFVPVYEFHTRFPAEGTAGLQEGADVQVLGTKVGSVKGISVADDGRMEALLTVKGDFIRFVCDDSVALAKKKLGGVGDIYIEISHGSGAAVESGAYLPYRQDADIFEQAQATVASVQKAIEEYTRLAEDLRNPEGNLQSFVLHLNEIAAGIERGEGTVGKVLRDPAMADDIAALVAGLNEAVTRLQGILADVKATTGTLRGEAVDMSGLVVQTQEAIDEATILIEGLQKHWLIRKYIDKDRDADTDVISPIDVRISRGE